MFWNWLAAREKKFPLLERGSVFKDFQTHVFGYPNTCVWICPLPGIKGHQCDPKEATQFDKWVLRSLLESLRFWCSRCFFCNRKEAISLFSLLFGLGIILFFNTVVPSARWLSSCLSFTLNCINLYFFALVKSFIYDWLEFWKEIRASFFLFHPELIFTGSKFSINLRELVEWNRPTNKMFCNNSPNKNVLK